MISVSPNNFNVYFIINTIVIIWKCFCLHVWNKGHLLYMLLQHGEMHFHFIIYFRPAISSGVCHGFNDFLAHFGNAQLRLGFSTMWNSHHTTYCTKYHHIFILVTNIPSYYYDHIIILILFRTIYSSKYFVMSVLSR